VIALERKMVIVHVGYDHAFNAIRVGVTRAAVCMQVFAAIALWNLPEVGC
jgi:hypothetical protein